MQKAVLPLVSDERTIEDGGQDDEAFVARAELKRHSLRPSSEQDQLNQELTSLLASINPNLIARYQGCYIGANPTEANKKNPTTRQARNSTLTYSYQDKTNSNQKPSQSSNEELAKTNSMRSLRSKRDSSATSNSSSCQ